MSKRLQDKITIITGSGRGIGRACALRYGAEGAVVFVNDINAANVEKVVAEIKADGGRAVAHPCDVTDPAQVQAMIDQAVKEYGRLDVLYANAGGSIPKNTRGSSLAKACAFTCRPASACAIPRRWSPCPPTAKPSAKSCSAATSA